MDVKRHIDVIRVNPQDWPDGTPAWKAETPELGHDVIPAGRYTSRDFMKIESLQSPPGRVWMPFAGHTELARGAA